MFIVPYRYLTRKRYRVRYGTVRYGTERELLDDMAAKLRSLIAEATVIAPYWPKKPWFVHLAEMSSKTIDMPPQQRPLLST